MRATLLASSAPARALAIARAWAEAGDTVTVVLLDAAAALARPGHADAAALADSVAAGVTVAAHDDALRRRGLTGSLADGVKAVDLDEVADLVTEGTTRAVWL